MTSTTEKILITGFILCLGLISLALILPAVIPFSGTGFDALASALGLFFLLLFAALLLAIPLAVWTGLKYKHLRWAYRAMGFAPLILLVIGLCGFILFVQFGKVS